MNVDEMLEAATSDFFWVPDDVQVVDREAITYSYSPRSEGNFNRVTRVRPQLADPGALVEEVYDRHLGSESLWCVNPMSDEPTMREALRQFGYKTGHTHHAYAVDPATYDRDLPQGVEVREVSTLEDLRTLYDIWVDVFDRQPDLTDQELANELDDCTGAHRRIARFVAFRNGEAAGSGGLTFFDDLSFGLIWAGSVREEHRGRGVYTTLLQARADAAADRGIERIGLYARDETSAPIVDAHGFERHGFMTYYEQDLTGET